MKRKAQSVKRKTKTLNLKLFLILLPFIIGCATIKEAAKCVGGVSTKALEDGRKEAIRKQFNYDLNSCFNKAETILREKGSYIYAKDLKKHMLAIYVSSEDTTAVGIFFKEIDATNTEIEVSSASTYAKEFIAKRLFLALEGLPNPEEKEGQADAKKEMRY